MAQTLSATDLRNRYLWIVFPFMFLFVLVANGALVYYALSSWPGLAFENPSERGRKFNQVLHEEEKETQLGWKFQIVPADNSVEVRASDAAGRALNDLALTGRLVRPLGKIADRPLEFRATAPGVYRAPVEFEARGQWEVRIAAIRDGERAHDAQRFLVP
jgi:nitrogen fixation protein FixH